mgnify:CR=1 FL=1
MTPFKDALPRFLKISATLLLAMFAALTLWWLYGYYTYAPQTRDGKIRADVVPMAADVSGRVSAVLVADNQIVRRGQLLFTVDPRRRGRLRNALRHARGIPVVQIGELTPAPDLVLMRNGVAEPLPGGFTHF